MAINGNLKAGQTIVMVAPKILVNGTELSGGLQVQDERLSFYRNKINYTAPATLTFSTAETNTDIHYTFNGRTPTSKSKKYTGPITLHQNSASNNTTIKARVFAHNNTNKVSKIIKGVVNVVGDNTGSFLAGH